MATQSPKADRATPLTDARRAGVEPSIKQLEHAARENMWMHFTRFSQFEESPIPIITKADGHHFWDQNGKKYFDGISSLFAVNAGHGRHRLAEAAAKQMKQLDYFPIWSNVHAPAVELAERLLSYAPKSLHRVFFTTGGGEANETAWKLAKQYFKMIGKPMKHKVLTRAVAYHGTSHGALSLTGIPSMKKAFEPLVPSTFRVPNTNWYRAQDDFETEDDFAIWAAGRVEEMILFEDPDTVAAFFLEPVQNSGGCFTAPKLYFKLIREICDKYDVILVADETIDAFGRIGTMFASEFYDFEPDMLVCAKGMTSAYAPIGALMVNERYFEPFKKGTAIFPHGYTYGGHPVSAAVALENLDIFDEEDLVGNVARNAGAFKATLDKLRDLPIVGDVRGEGYFYAIELVKDKETRETFNDEESEKLLRGFLSTHLYDAGLYCRSDDRGDPVVQLAPPLTIGQPEFDELEGLLRDSLSKAWDLWKHGSPFSLACYPNHMIARSTFDSPVGHINLVADGDSIIELTMAQTPGPTIGSAKVLKEAQKQLTEYFKGKRKEFNFKFEARGTKFQQSVWNQIAKVPFGEVVSYADIAREIGKPQASRAVGGAVGSNPIPLLIGCHRVLGASGKITGYSGGEGIPTKRWLLKLEHIETKD